MIIKINSTKNDKIRRLSDFTPASLARSTLYLLDDYIVIRRRGYHTPPGGETISRVIELFCLDFFSRPSLHYPRTILKYGAGLKFESKSQCSSRTSII